MKAQFRSPITAADAGTSRWRLLLHMGFNALLWGGFGLYAAAKGEWSFATAEGFIGLFSAFAGGFIFGCDVVAAKVQHGPAYSSNARQAG
jgi:hypothetical protein